MRGATADMHCDGSRDLGWRETGAGVYHPVITVTAAGTWGGGRPGASVYHPVITVTAVLTVLLKD